MRKLFIFCAAILVTAGAYAGGLVTNTNQSAMYTRLQSRNASTAVDAVYYNPAGLLSLGNGFFASVNNQVIGQTKTITNNYQFLQGAPKEFKGTVSAPFFPGVYLAYNTGKLSFSAGVNPIGGGGSAKYAKGLPSFESQIANLVPLLNSKGIPTTLYAADINFEGSSIYLGFQGNVGYKINDKISVAAGLRLVTANNTYKGYMKNISINPNYPVFGATGSMVKANEFFTAGAGILNALAAGANQFATGFQQIVNGGGGSLTIAQAVGAGLITQAQADQAGQVLGAAGMTPAQIGAVSIAVAQGTFAVAGPGFTQKATEMSTYAGMTQDIEVDAEQSGTGYTPVISVNVTPSEKLNIAVRYEFKTSLELNTTVANNKGAGIFANGQKVIADMPAMLAIGADYKILDHLLISGSMNMYFDKGVDYDGSKLVNIDMIDKNSSEYALGLEYSLSDKMRASAGWLGTYVGVNSNYQSDMQYDLNANSFGAGIGYSITPMIDLNIGGQYTTYKEDSKSFTDETTSVSGLEKYKTSTWVIGIGLDLHFGK